VVALPVFAVKPPGPDHLKVAPVVEDVPESVTLVTLQVSVPETVAVAPGAALFSSTSTVAVDVHPLVGCVAVTV
jgi:hypothetical protein